MQVLLDNMAYADDDEALQDGDVRRDVWCLFCSFLQHIYPPLLLLYYNWRWLSPYSWLDFLLPWVCCTTVFSTGTTPPKARSCGPTGCVDVIVRVVSQQICQLLQQAKHGLLLLFVYLLQEDENAPDREQVI